MNENFICHCQGERQLNIDLSEKGVRVSRLLQPVMGEDDQIEECFPSEPTDVLRRERKKDTLIQSRKRFIIHWCD